MANINQLDLLILIIALSAYVASIRLAVIQRLAVTPAPTNAESLRSYLKWLLPGDIPLVVSAVVLSLNIFWQELVVGPFANVLGAHPPSWFSPLVVWLFVFAVLVLSLHHVAAWVRSAR